MYFFAFSILCIRLSCCPSSYSSNQTPNLLETILLWLFYLLAISDISNDRDFFESHFVEFDLQTSEWIPFKQPKSYYSYWYRIWKENCFRFTKYLRQFAIFCFIKDSMRLTDLFLTLGQFIHTIFYNCSFRISTISSNRTHYFFIILPNLYVKVHFQKCKSKIRYIVKMRLIWRRNTDLFIWEIQTIFLDFKISHGKDGFYPFISKV